MECLQKPFCLIEAFLVELGRKAGLTLADGSMRLWGRASPVPDGVVQGGVLEPVQRVQVRPLPDEIFDGLQLLMFRSSRPKQKANQSQTCLPTSQPTRFGERAAASTSRGAPY
jgi:hypothetical protein